MQFSFRGREECFLVDSRILRPLRSVSVHMNYDWTRISLVAQAVLFVYYQAIEWVNLFAWNDIRRGNGQASVDLIFAAIMGALILVTWRRLRWLIVTAIALYGLWLWLQVDSWWLPYFRAERHQPGNARTTRSLRRQSGFFRPTASTSLLMHVTLRYRHS
jgi:hypothetical protein